MRELLLGELAEILANLLGKESNLSLNELHRIYKAENCTDAYGDQVLRYILYSEDKEDIRVLGSAVTYFKEK